jgi:hypothetical protein
LFVGVFMLLHAMVFGFGFLNYFLKVLLRRAKLVTFLLIDRRTPS